MKLLFEFGHQPQLSYAELTSVLQSRGIATQSKQFSKNFLSLSCDATISALELINQLGGTISISQAIGTGNIIALAIKHLDTAQPSGKVTFSLQGTKNRQMALTIKKKLKALGRSARYVEVKSGASLLHNQLIKKSGALFLYQDELFVIDALQPFEAFKTRDDDRPYRDIKSGVLPPKLARILINLTGVSPKSHTLLDPFCGSGTLINEAIDLGFQSIVGSDSSKSAITGTQQNAEWLIDRFKNEPKKLDFYHEDVSKLHIKLEKATVNAIATEPYMGKPLRGNDSYNFLEQQAHELAELYTEAFKSFTKILAKNATVVFVFPAFRYDEEFIDTASLCSAVIKSLGFQVIPMLPKQTYIRYSRPDQYVARDIWRFRFN